MAPPAEPVSWASMVEGEIGGERGGVGDGDGDGDGHAWYAICM